MNRREEILKYVNKEMRGIEVGPWFAPLAPKREGYRCLSLDVFDTDTLLSRAKADPNVSATSIPLIESVDLIGSSTEIAALVDARSELGQYDYIISSHNFEHVPNPLRFLQGCGQVLKRSGMLSMAVPDRRACFDRFRGNTRLTEWIEPYFEQRAQPTLAQIFDQAIRFCPDSATEVKYEVRCNLREEFAAWQSQIGLSSHSYTDTHCWTFTPTSFHLLVMELHHLGLSPFVPVEVSGTFGNEFFVHLENVGCEAGALQDERDFYERRQVLLDMLRVELNYFSESSQVSVPTCVPTEESVSWAKSFERRLRRSLRAVIGIHKRNKRA